MNHREFLFRSLRPRPSNGPYGEGLNSVCTRRGPRAAQWTRALRGHPALPFILTAPKPALLRFAPVRCKTPHARGTRARKIISISATTAPSAQRTCETVQSRRATLACLWLTAREYEGRRGAGECSPETAIAAAAGRRATQGTRETVSAPGPSRRRGVPIHPPRYGQIEWHCDGVNCWSCALPGQLALAVYSDRPRLFEKLWAIPGVRRHQTGDTEMRAVFPPDALEQVALVIKARRRRSLSPEDARRRGFKPTHGATSGT